MNCKNCGSPLMGMEHACPVCGAPLPTNQPNPAMPGAVNPMQPPMPAVPQQMTNMPPQMMPADPNAVPMGVPTPAAPTKEEPPKKSNKALAILLVVVALAAIGVGVFLAVTDEKESARPTPKPSEQQSESNDDDSKEQTQVNGTTYAGFRFNLPADYTSNIDPGKGLVIKGDNTYFTILIDYTNSYEYYKGEFLKAFPAQAPNMVQMIDDKEYVAAILTDPTGALGTEYMTKADEGTSVTFVGLVVRADSTAPTSADFAVLNEILATASKEGEIMPGDVEDAGKAGIINFIPTFNKAEFVF